MTSSPPTGRDTRASAAGKVHEFVVLRNGRTPPPLEAYAKALSVFRQIRRPPLSSA